MTDEEYESGVEDLGEMLRNLRRIKNKGLRKGLLREIRAQLLKIVNAD